MAVDVPVLRISLERLELSLLSYLETQMGELEVAIREGVRVASEIIPGLVAMRVKEGVLAAVSDATDRALAEYYSPGGAGFEQIRDMVFKMQKGG